MLRAVIIDDEELGRKYLAGIVAKHCPQINLIGYGDSVESGIAVIIETKPNIVFLDLRLGERSGFDIIHEFPEAQFSLIITSAYDEYAIEAFKHFAISYLLKPIPVAELTKTVEYVARKMKLNEPGFNSKKLVKSAENFQRKKILIPDMNGISFFFVDEIIRLEAEGAYTRVIFKTIPSILASKRIGDFETDLCKNANFIRTHRSLIINTDEIIRYADSTHIIMSDGVQTTLSRRKKSKFMERIMRTR